jgi:hypothetical protein
MFICPVIDMVDTALPRNGPRRQSKVSYRVDEFRARRTTLAPRLPESRARLCEGTKSRCFVTESGVVVVYILGRVDGKRSRSAGFYAVSLECETFDSIMCLYKVGVMCTDS